MNSTRGCSLCLCLILLLLGCGQQSSEGYMGFDQRFLLGAGPGAQDRRLRTPTAHAFIQPALDIIKSDINLFERLRDVPQGGSIAPQRDEPRDECAWANIGFLPDRGGRHRRAADLITELAELVLTDLPAMSEVDCVAIISIDRANSDKPYLYDTLRSLFRAFPEGTHVNVLVGDDNLDYVAGERLAQEVGARDAALVHIWPTSARTSAYLKAHLPANRRGGWNYTRALRSYQGSKGLVLMEDDVIWAPGGVERFNSWLRGRHLPAVSLFNDRCEHLSGTSDYLSGDLVFNEVDTEHFAFWNLQGMYYSAEIAGSVGRWVQLRMHQAVYDNVIGYFFSHNKARIAYAFPSIVQHIGRYTACESTGFHTSPCFRERF